MHIGPPAERSLSARNLPVLEVVAPRARAQAEVALGLRCAPRLMYRKGLIRAYRVCGDFAATPSVQQFAEKC